MPTRHASPESDFAPERHLASGKLRGLNIGRNVVTRVATVHDDAMARAMMWMAGYAHERRVSADALSEELGLSKADIRSALTDPDIEPEDARRFAVAVAKARHAYEAGLPVPAETHVVDETRKAVKFAMGKGRIAELTGETRLGKTTAMMDVYHRNLDCVLYIRVPSDESIASFLAEIARALGIGTGGGKKSVMVRAQIKAVFATGMIRLLILDEAHFLFPSDPTLRAKRLEFVRELWEVREGEIGVLIGATPQWNTCLRAQIKHSPRWNPGQWDGRRAPFVLKDSLSDSDLDAIARHHAGPIEDGAVAALVLMAKSQDGYVGKLTICIDLARSLYRDTGTLTVADIEKAQIRLSKGDRQAEVADQLLLRHPRPRAARR